jgi:Domain of unknown function (DUF4136)
MSMKTPALLAAILVAAATACNPVTVRTTTAPDAHLANLRTFTIATPRAKKANAVSDSNDPMLANSISNQALRQDLAADFQSKGYTLTTASPSFAVAYYASAQQKLDVTDWDYGYSYWGYHRFWHGYGYPYETIQQYTEGTVVVDVIDPATKELLWRGQGKAAVSKDPAAYTAELAKTVRAIVAKFPAAGAEVAQQ